MGLAKPGPLGGSLPAPGVILTSVAR